LKKKIELWKRKFEVQSQRKIIFRMYGIGLEFEIAQGKTVVCGVKPGSSCSLQVAA